jgi:hypothetical protein
MEAFAAANSMNLAFPYTSGGGSAAIQGAGEVAWQFGAATTATQIAYYALMAAARDSGPINVITFSGGAQAFNAALAFVPADVKDRINNVTYISPGSVNSGLFAGSGITEAILGTDEAREYLITALNTVPLGTHFTYTDCGHNANCQIPAVSALLASRLGNPCSETTTLWRDGGELAPRWGAVGGSSDGSSWYSSTSLWFWFAANLGLSHGGYQVTTSIHYIFPD